MRHPAKRFTVINVDLRKSQRLFLLLILLGVGLAGPYAQQVSEPNQATGTVLLTRIEGAIGPATAHQVTEAVAEAESRGSRGSP